MKKALIVGSLLVAGVVSWAASVHGDQPKPAQEQKKPTATQVDQAAIKRTRESVQMLDNIYKQTIVLITEKYVLTEDDYAAGSAAVELFRRIGEGGSHQVRLIDVTGDPYDPENVAVNEFEQQGVERIKAGEAYHDEVAVKDGKPYLRAMTAVPVVMQRCVMCHSHYEDVKAGAAIGAIVYELPIK